MITNIEHIRNDEMTFHIFWHSEIKEIPKLVKLALASWDMQGHNINVWTLGDTYDFDVDVKFIDLTKIADDIPLDMMYAQRRPFGEDGRYIAGFVDWCRFKIMSLLPKCTIMDTDVILLKPFINDKLTLVCEDSFRASNTLSGYYPCAGIITDVGVMGNVLIPLATQNIHDGMVHGHLMKLIYQNCVENYKEQFENKKNGEETNINIIEHNQFFELYYDEIDLFYVPLERKTIRRLKDVKGIHCWMSILDEEKAFKDYTILDILWKIIKVHDCKPTYDLLKIRGAELF